MKPTCLRARPLERHRGLGCETDSDRYLESCRRLLRCLRTTEVGGVRPSSRNRAQNGDNCRIYPLTSDPPDRCYFRPRGDCTGAGDATAPLQYGCDTLQTVRRVVLLRALSGVFTGTILALVRAIGEATPLVMIGVATTRFNPPAGLVGKMTAMPMQIFT